MAAQQAASAQAQASQMNSNSQYYRHPQQMSPQQPGSPAGMVQQQHVQRNPAAVNGMMSHPQTPVSVGPSPSPVLSQPSAAYPNHAQTHNVELYRQQQAQAQAQAQVRQRQHLRAELPQRSQSLHAIPASTSAMAPPAHMRPSTPASIHSAHGPSQSPEQAFSVQPSPRHAAAQPPQMRAQQQQQPQQVAQAPRASVAGATPPTPSQSLQSQRLPTMPSGMSRVMKCLDDLSELCSSDQTTMSDIVAFVQEYFVEHATITINLKGRASSRSSEEQRQQQHRESNSDAGEQKDAKTISYSFPPVALVSFFFSMRATGMKSCQLYLARCAEFTVDPADTTTPDDQYTRIESRHFSMLTSSFHKADGHPSPNDSNGITSHSTVLGRMSSRLSKQPVHSPSSLQNGQPISGYTWRLETFKLVFEQQFISVDITQLAMEPTVLDLTGQQHLKLGSNGAALTEGRHTNSSLFDNTSPDAPQTSDLSRTTSAPGQETAQARTVRQFADSLTCPNFLDRLHEWLQVSTMSLFVDTESDQRVSSSPLPV